MIYLDHNATTPVLPEVREAMLPFLAEQWGNPSSSYRFGSHLKSAIEGAREKVADLMGAQSAHEVHFTSGGTESNNTALHAVIHSTPKKHIITSLVEHSSVLGYCRFLEEFRGYRLTYLPVDQEGLISIPQLEAAIQTDTALVSLMWANNETGVLFPVEEIGQLCRDRGVLYHCDAVQAVGKLLMKVKDLPIDYLSLTGHKIGAPKGIGALYIQQKAPFLPFVHGGQQERSRRGGTENVAGIIGLGTAAAVAQKKLPAYDATVRPLRDALEEGILTAIPNTQRNGHVIQRLPNTTNIFLPGMDSDATLTFLDSQNICASSGSACMESAITPSHVIKTMSGSHERSSESIRFSLAPENTMEEIHAVLHNMKGLMSLID
ncbi:cysteine desulfurase family protein [Prosthecobacter dejongeii]|uniref:cysteine desulfurase n=1 Tax=Prosthecobacter dejongeii TaxID=48465 RepID=A0A7W7YH67_9BACT|nr:aminotransferase class V-fold PLP-dependent enzyme [Prosthecobacter dejongeii]MBB5036146.1 cysteine desulfurase [Prosthecobacter dejongeii]